MNTKLWLAKEFNFLRIPFFHADNHGKITQISDVGCLAEILMYLGYLFSKKSTVYNVLRDQAIDFGKLLVVV